MLKVLKKYICVSLTILLAMTAQSQAQETFSLEEAVQYAFQKSEQLQLDRLDVEDAQGRIREYWSQGIPSLSLSGNYNYSIVLPAQLLPAEFLGGAPGEYLEIRFGLNNSLSGSLEFNTLLFSGSFLVGLKAQKLFKELSIKQLDVSKVDIRENVYKAYVNVLLSQKMLEVLDSNLEVIEKSLEEVTKSFEAGFQEKLEVDRIELSRKNLQTEIETVRSSLLIAMSLLKFQMGYPLDEALVLSQSLEDVTTEIRLNKVEENIEFTLEQRIEWEQLVLQEQLNEVNVKQLRAGYLPELRGFANYQQMLSRDDLFDADGPGWIESSVAGVSLSFPIFDGFARSAKIQRANVDLAKVGVQKSLLERQVNMEVQTNKLQMMNARKKLNSAEDAMQLAENIYNTMQIKFREGVESSFNLTQSEQELYSTQSTYFNAMYDLFIAYTDLQRSIGTF